MHPGFFWWKYGRDHFGHGGHEHEAACGPGGGRGWGRGRGFEAAPDHDGHGGFGVRRPLRFLAHKLELDEAQVGELARILGELKTERAQAEVDQRRTMSALADAIAGEKFDDAKAADGSAVRTKSAERVRDAVTTALKKIHALLRADQRERLAYLIRTGVVTL